MPGSPYRWFEDELKLMAPDLRLVWGLEPYGWPCWVVERRIPEWSRVFGPDIDAGKPRFAYRNIAGEWHRYDTMPEWMGVHFIHEEGVPRPPDRRDLTSLRRWLFEFGRSADQAVHDRLKREARDAKYEKDHDDEVGYRLKTNRRWRDPLTGLDENDPFGGQPQQVMEGTQFYE